jgi:hypothetical protein
MAERRPMNLERCLHALDWCEIYKRAAAAGAPYGLTADEVLDEAMALLALPPDELQRQLNWLEAIGETDVQP